MAKKEELVHRVLAGVQGDEAAIKKLSDAIVTRDPEEIRRVLSNVAKVDITAEESRQLVDELGPEPMQAVGYAT